MIPKWQIWGEYVWLGLVLVGLGFEIYAAFFNPHVPTFTGMVKKFVKPTWRAAALGVLIYHFLLQPIYEALKAKGVDIF